MMVVKNALGKNEKYTELEHTPTLLHMLLHGNFTVDK